MLANANRDPKKKSQPYKPDDFHPDPGEKPPKEEALEIESLRPMKRRFVES
ncbi:hypothetical protein ACERK3_09385 [Phycisphaerales bacterium AB-hyl4]|uniref:Uncharacterized protein n=1 Tax=Natronomicrosphaera hydrolytica TaxID=3242702 RepID=A0ABV4U5A3_9BACT